MSRLDESVKLLEEARGVLENYWFSEVDDSYNNEDVIEISEKIDKFFNKVKEE